MKGYYLTRADQWDRPGALLTLRQRYSDGDRRVAVLLTWPRVGALYLAVMVGAVVWGTL